MSEAVVALNAGRLVGVPTDTVYGIAVDAWSESGMKLLSDLKGRAPEQPVALLVADLRRAGRLASVSSAALNLAKEHWPGSLTLVLPAAPDLPVWMQARGTVGLRVPNHPVALDLIERVGTLAVTSANLTGETPAVDHAHAHSMFSDAVAGYLPGERGVGAASTVLDVTVDPPVLLREGPVTVDRWDA